jgi:hypothetical protein
MRTSTFFDWFCEVLLLAIFCGAVTLADYCMTTKDPIMTMWCVAGGFVTTGLVRFIGRKLSGRAGDPQTT